MNKDTKKELTEERVREIVKEEIEVYFDASEELFEKHLKLLAWSVDE